MRTDQRNAALMLCIAILGAALTGVVGAQGAATAQITSDPSLDITLESFKGTLSPIAVEASPGDVVQVQVHSNYNGPLEHVGICLVVDGRYNPPGILSFFPEPGYSPSETRGESYYWDFGTTGQDARTTVMNIKVSNSAVPCNSYRAFVEMGYYWKSGESEDITTQPITIHIRCEKPTPPKPECTSGWTSEYRCVGNKVERLYVNADCTEEWKIQDDCDRYSPPRICENGRCECMSGPPGLTQTYRCYNNQVQQVYRNRDCTEVWQVKDDCNKYDPPRKCLGGVCFSGPTPPPPPEKNCSQAKCQEGNKFFGDILCKDDGKTTYQKYKECNCVNNTCKCISVKKDVSKGFISGHVYDAVTKEPIAGATVFTSRCAASTDANGYFRLYQCTPCPTFAPFSHYATHCNAPGYMMIGNMPASTDEDGNAIVDFNLTRCDFESVEIDPVQVIYNAPWFVVGKPTAVRLKIKSNAAPTLTRVKLTFGYNALEGDLLIKPDVENYWIPNENWSVPWIEFPAEGIYKMSVKVDSVGKYPELDESNNEKEVTVVAKKSKRNELRIIYVIIKVDNQSVTDEQLNKYAEESSALIKATFPITNVVVNCSDTTLIQDGNEWRYFGEVRSNDVLDTLSRSLKPGTYDYVVGVMPEQTKTWFKEGYSFPYSYIGVKDAVLARSDDISAPAHEIGHCEGLWSSGEEYDYTPSRGNPSDVYWVEHHQARDGYCLMGLVSCKSINDCNSWICDECYKNLLNRFA